jgi:dihydrofolate reductase
MRRILESTLMSFDGVIGDPPAWAMSYFDNEARAEALEQLLASDAMLMGRRTYEAFAALWPAQTGDCADRLNSMPKYVFSSTLEKADWNNSTIVSGDVVSEVAKLKQLDGRDLVIYGHGLLGRTLLEHGLLDELRVALHPVIVGRGALLFREGERTALELVATRHRDNGVVVLTYQPAEPPRSEAEGGSAAAAEPTRAPLATSS